jgi:hypothetical protein
MGRYSDSYGTAQRRRWRAEVDGWMEEKHHMDAPCRELCALYVLIVAENRTPAPHVGQWSLWQCLVAQS